MHDFCRISKFSHTCFIRWKVQGFGNSVKILHIRIAYHHTESQARIHEESEWLNLILKFVYILWFKSTCILNILASPLFSGRQMNCITGSTFQHWFSTTTKIIMRALYKTDGSISKSCSDSSKIKYAAIVLDQIWHVVDIASNGIKYILTNKH